VKDVAALCGVSFQTTSKVLNGKGSVSEATRARILRAAQDLGYVPNRQARSLVMRRTHTVGLLAGDLVDHALAEVVVGAEQQARRQGYSVLISTLGPADTTLEGSLPALLEHRVDGILLAAPQLEGDSDRPRLRDVTVPMVSLHPVGDAGIATVGSDHVLTGYLATSHLLAKGRRTIATITGRQSRRMAQERLRGYLIALEEAGVAFDESLVEEGDWDVNAAYAATLRVLDRRPETDAIFAQNDVMAIGVLSALRGRGVGVPDACAVAGCDDMELAAHASPALTTVRVPFRETGGAAIETLVSLIETSLEVPPRRLLPVELVERESTAS
jgi:LacI family transcriptional regulator